MRTKTLKLYLLSLFVGIIVGLVGSTFRLSIDLLSGALGNFYQLLGNQGWPVGIISGLISMLMVLSAFFAVKYIVPDAAGSGVPEIEGALLHLRPIYWKRLLPVKFFFGILAMSSQMILGREGPTIHIGGGLGEMLGTLFKLSRRRRDSLIAAGAAAGLAVAFNAPLAGVVFVMEEMRNQFNYSFTSFTMVVICCLVATVIMSLMIGPQATIQMDVFQFPALKSLWLFALFGIVVGVVGLLFNLALMRVLIAMDKLSMTQKTMFVAVVGFLVGFLAVHYPLMVGGGLNIIHPALTMNPVLGFLCILIVVRFIITIACYASSVPGGIFAPTLALGMLLGLALYQVLTLLHLDFLTQSGMFAVAGMAAFFAAITRSPITGGILVVELTQNYSLIFPVMMACITATIVLQLANNGPIYVQLLGRVLKRNSSSFT